MSTQVAARRETSAFRPAAHSASLADVVARLFTSLAVLHQLPESDAALIERAASGLRFIRATRPDAETEQALLRIALSDLDEESSFVIEASSSYAADRVLRDDSGAWDRLDRNGRVRILWFAAILRLSECIDAVCGGRTGTIYAAWTDTLLHLEVDGCELAARDIDRVLRRVAALEAVSGRRVVLTSSICRRGAA